MHTTNYQHRQGIEVRAQRKVMVAKAEELVAQGRCPGNNCGAEWEREPHDPECWHLATFGEARLNAELNARRAKGAK